jgi:hypothetical protein
MTYFSLDQLFESSENSEQITKSQIAGNISDKSFSDNLSKTTIQFLKKSFNNEFWIVKKLKKLKNRISSHKAKIIASIPLFLSEYISKHLLSKYTKEQWKNILDDPKLFRKVVVTFWKHSWRVAAQLYQTITKSLPIQVVYKIFQNVRLIMYLTWIVVYLSVSTTLTTSYLIVKFFLDTSLLFLKFIMIEPIKMINNYKITSSQFAIIGILIYCVYIFFKEEKQNDNPLHETDTQQYQRLVDEYKEEVHFRDTLLQDFSHVRE